MIDHIGILEDHIVALERKIVEAHDRKYYELELDLSDRLVAAVNAYAELCERGHKRILPIPEQTKP